MSKAEWRTVCRQAAAEQASAEAHAGWRLAGDQTIPFDHRWEHVQEVVRLALWLAHETGADLETIEAAAWLHDVGKGQPAHAALGAAAAIQILADTDFPPAKIAAVADTIRQHEKMHRPEGAAPLQPVEAAVLWDADKLTKIGVQALAFLLSSHYLAGQTLKKRLRECEKFVQETLNRTVRSMNTAPARHLAEERYQHMVFIVDLWRQEADF
jgi:uncharacterized protein